MKRILDPLNNNKELVIVAIILFVLLMMIIPLPTFLMDFIIASNITLTVLIMMVVIYMRSPLNLSSFPSILLVLAMVRIGITVSTSRLILLDGNAGEIVSTFGEYVVGGNLVVGIIIFSIITIINFIVITKGSERVAEVAARFSLDAMPGKQMSIDSDLRAGNISMEEAAKRRTELALESKLYGAMDGAMKFVKGDAIASIIDIIINLVGGIVIGMLQKNLDFSSAIKVYSILTVGDGLVQQIPALIVSLTAGMMITRVNDGADESMGQNILRQVFKEHKALFSSGGLLIILAFIPGMPSIVFGFLFICLIALGFFLKNKDKLLVGQSGSITEKAVFEDGRNHESALDTTQDITKNMKLLPLLLYLSANYRNSPSLNTIKKIIIQIQQSILADLGVLLPQIVIRYNETLKDDEYQLLVHEIPVITGKIHWQKILLLDTKEHQLSVIDLQDSFENTVEFGGAVFGMWVNQQNASICDKYSMQYITCEQFLLAHFKFQLRTYVSDFLGIQEVKLILDRMQEFQELIKELLRMMPLNKITEVFQRLVAENISIRNFKLILDTLLESAQNEKDTVLLTEIVRKALGKYIAYKFSEGEYLFATILLSAEIEDMIRDSIRYSNNGSYLALDPHYSANIIGQIKKITNSKNNIKHLIILTQLDIRRYVRFLIEKELAFLPVMSVQELEGHAEFQNVGVVNVIDDDFEDLD